MAWQEESCTVAKIITKKLQPAKPVFVFYPFFEPISLDGERAHIIVTAVQVSSRFARAAWYVQLLVRGISDTPPVPTLFFWRSPTAGCRARPFVRVKEP